MLMGWEGVNPEGKGKAAGRGTLAGITIGFPTLPPLPQQVAVSKRSKSQSSSHGEGPGGLLFELFADKLATSEAHAGVKVNVAEGGTVVHGNGMMSTPSGVALSVPFSPAVPSCNVLTFVCCWWGTLLTG